MQKRWVRFRRGPWSALCLLMAFLLGGSTGGTGRAEVGETITLDEARRLALAGNLELAGRALDVKAADGAARQVRAWPNPEIGVEVEEFGGDLPKWSGSQTTWSVSQRIELPMARRARIAAARGDRRVATLDYERASLDLLAEVDRRFATLLAEQSRLEVARQNERNADTLLAAVSSLVNAGEVSPIEEDRARADRSRAGIGVRRAETAAARARMELASLWGNPAAAAWRAEGTLEIDPVLPAVAALDSLGADTPDLARWDAAVARSEAGLRMQRWSRLPDVTVGGGTRRSNASGDQTWTALASLDFPLWNRNGGAVTEAVARASQARAARQAGRLRVTAERRIALDAMAGSLAVVRTYRELTRPEVRRAYDAVSEGYRRGKFPLIDLLDARRSLAEAELGYVDALLELWSARIDLERLLAKARNATGGEEQ
jgi:outer membrane protein, heavy metal efflux system